MSFFSLFRQDVEKTNRTKKAIRERFRDAKLDSAQLTGADGEILIGKLLDGDMSHPEFVRLNEEFSQSSELRTEYLQQSWIHCQLEDLFQSLD